MEAEKHDWTDEDSKILFDAMQKAKLAFDNYINNELGLDGCYFGLNLQGVTFYSDLESIKSRIKLNFFEDKEIKN